MATPEELRNKGNTYFANGQWEESITYYTKAIDLLVELKTKDPLSFTADRKDALAKCYSNRSAAYLSKSRECMVSEKNGMIMKSLNDAEKCVNVLPFWPKGYIRQVNAYRALEQMDEVLRCANAGVEKLEEEKARLTEDSPGYVDFIAGYDSLKATRDELQVVKDAQPEVDSAERERLEGNRAFGVGEWNAAISHYTEAINILVGEGKDMDKRIFSNRSAAYAKKAQDIDSQMVYQYAVEDADKVIELDPDWPKGHHRKVNALMLMGKLPEAETALDEGLKRCPLEPDLMKLKEELRKKKNEGGGSSSSGGGGATGSGSGGGGGGGAGFAEDRARPAYAASDGPAGNAYKPKKRHEVAETDLYDTLGVPTDATESDIKRAYYRLAKENHPDKNKDDPLATERFQKLGLAYQVLGSDNTRELYDMRGMQGVMNSESYEPVDPSALFAMVFGSDKFEKYIGELQVAMMAGMAGTPDQQVLKEKQAKRIEKLQNQLIAILHPYVEATTDAAKEQFSTWAMDEAKNLSDANFGEPMLYTIGYIYTSIASIYEGKSFLLGVPGFFKGIGYKGHKANRTISAVATATEVMKQQRQIEEKKAAAAKAGKALTPEQLAEMEKDLSKGMLDVIWKMTVLDIQSTLDPVCHYVLSGKDLPAEKTKINIGEKVKGILPFGKKKDDSGGAKVLTKEQICAARIAALKKIGKVFMEHGSEEAVKSGILNLNEAFAGGGSPPAPDGSGA